MRALVLGLIALAVAACGGAARVERASAASSGLRLVEVASGLDAPVHLAAVPGEPGRLYVVEQPGRILVLEDGAVRGEPFLDIRSRVSCCSEQGLLSVAFHPGYEQNRRFYVNYTNGSGDTEVVEYRSNGQRALPGSRRLLLRVDQPYANHNGGQLAFGPDGKLYVGMGDGGSGGDPENRAQNLSTALGKLLRIDVEKRRARPQLVAYGLRNPWRFSFDRQSGDLYIGDVGQGDFEEIDYLPRSSSGLVDFGWDVYEGRARFESKRRNTRGRLVFPIAVYDHGQGCSVTGGFVYRGSAAPEAQGRYFYGDYCSGTVWSLRVRSGKAAGVRREPFRVEGLSSFGEDAEGELYLVSLGGAIYRLAPA